MPPTLENTPAILFKGGVMFKSLALCGLVSAGTFSAVPANASVIGYVEWLYYDFAYYAPDTSISVISDYNEHTRTAYSYGENTGFYRLVEFGFALVGTEAGRIAGKALELTSSGLDASFPDHGPGTFYLYDNGFGFDGQSGHVAFGPDESITSWSYSGYRSDGGSTGFSTSSNPSALALDRSVLDPQNLNGSLVYDQYYFEPDDLYFSTRPGYWTTTASKVCLVTEDGQPYDTTECRPAVASVPLPASSPLLFGALCLLLGLYFTRKRPAGI
jgi:hypothetical protein